MTDCWIEMGEIRRYFVQKRGQVVTLVETKGGGGDCVLLFKTMLFNERT